MKHENNGACPKCQAIFNTFPGFEPRLRAWFEELQGRYPVAHISCAGRGKAAQADALAKGMSRAPYGKSAHNYNAAIDIFEMSGISTDIYERAWFKTVVEPNLKDFLSWYGAPGASFPELPHVEVKEWRELARNGKLSLVE